MAGSGRLVLIHGGRWEMELVGGGLSKTMGDYSHKQVGDGRLAPKTGGRWEVESPATSHPH